MKVNFISEDIFEEFAKNHRYRNFYQTKEYGNIFKNINFNYQVAYIGIINDEQKLIGASLILYKKEFMSKKIAYAPRGILINYENYDNIKEMSKKLYKFLSKQGFMTLTIDPYIPLSVRDASGNIINYNQSSTEIIDNIKKIGFNYVGKNLFFETEKPRWEALIILNKNPNNLFSNFDKMTRRKIRKASNSGINIYKDKEKNITKLYNLLSKKSARPLSFYKELIASFKDNIDIYYAKLDTEEYLIKSRKMYEKEVDYNNMLADQIQDISLDEKERQLILNKKLESDKLVTSYKDSMISSTNLIKDNPEGIIIAGAIVIKYDNAAFIYEEGRNDNYSNIYPLHLIKWQMINDYFEQKFKYINLNGIAGEFENKHEFSGLNEIKLGFNPIVTEYIGEFNIVLDKITNKIYESLK